MEKLNLGEGSDEEVEAELRKLLKEQFLQFLPGSDLADAFVDDAVALMRNMMQQYDPDGETGRSILREIQTLIKRLYEKFGSDDVDDEALLADLEALMRELWQKYGPGSEINQAFTTAWIELLKKYGKRIILLHLHDERNTGESGRIDFDSIIKKGIETGVKDIFIEVRCFSFPPMKCAERSLYNVLALPSVRY